MELVWYNEYFISIVDTDGLVLYRFGKSYVYGFKTVIHKQERCLMFLSLREWFMCKSI